MELSIDVDRLRIENTDWGQQRVVILGAAREGDILCSFSGENQGTPSRFTVQISDTEHIQLQPEILQYINHSCRPNVIFDVTAMAVRVLRPVAAGDELRYFYPSTEWSMVEPFICNCGMPECLRSVSGAAHLPPEVLHRYDFEPHIRARLPFRLTPPIPMVRRAMARRARAR